MLTNVDQTAEKRLKIKSNGQNTVYNNAQEAFKLCLFLEIPLCCLKRQANNVDVYFKTYAI